MCKDYINFTLSIIMEKMPMKILTPFLDSATLKHSWKIKVKGKGKRGFV